MRNELFVAALLLASAHATALAAPGESSFTPVSLKVPIHAVRLESSSSNLGADIYRCATDIGGVPAPMLGVDAGGESDADGGAGASGDCLVDMADNAALAALFARMADVPLGTYDVIRVYLCSAGAQGYTSYVKGSVELNGATYYTTYGHDVLSADNAHWGFTPVDYSGCASDVPLPAPITVQDGDVVTISSFFSLRNIAWATLTGNGPGGCTFDLGHGQSVCTAYPIPITYVGDTSPTLDTYYITEDVTDLTAAKAGGQMLIMRDGGGVAFGGFSRRLYSATSVQPSVNYDTPIKTISANPMTSPQSYTIETYGGGSPGGVPIAFYLRFTQFLLDTHQGSMQRADSMFIDYRAVKQ